MRRRLPMALLGAGLALLLVAAPTLACGGLIGPNGAVNLLRTTTFAGYHDGVEHYVTVVRVRGRRRRVRLAHAAARRPVERREGRRLDAPAAHPRDRRRSRVLASMPCRAQATSAGSAEVLMEVQIDALDITVLKGGAAEVGQWASDHGFRLPPDAPEVLDFYAKRSPIFLAAVFDADAAKERGQEVGDGTPVHISDPDDEPVGPDPHPRPRQDRPGPRRRRRLPPDRPRAGIPARADRPQRHAPRPQRRRDVPAARRPAVGPGHGVGSEIAAG